MESSAVRVPLGRHTRLRIGRLSNGPLIQAAIDDVPDLAKPPHMQIIANIGNHCLQFIGVIEREFTAL